MHFTPTKRFSKKMTTTSTPATKTTFANRFATAIDANPDLMTAALSFYANEKDMMEKLDFSSHPDDEEIEANFTEDVKPLVHHISAVKKEFGMINDKAILKRADAGTMTRADLDSIRRKDLLAAEYCVLVHRKIEAVEDYLFNVDTNTKQREERERLEFLQLEEKVKREEADAVIKGKVSFFFNATADTCDEALLEKTEELMITHLGEGDVTAELTSILKTIASVKEGRDRLLKIFGDGSDTIDTGVLAKHLVQLYTRASTTTLD